MLRSSTNYLKLVVRAAISTGLFFLCLATAGECAEFAVSPGDDLQEIADGLRPGDVMRFAKGDYRQSLTIRASGTRSDPIRIEGGGAARFCGLNELRCQWVPDRGGIYKAQVGTRVSQFFVDGKLMTPARWPNMSFEMRWDNSKWPAADEGSKYGTMVDADLAGAGADFTGCVAILNIGAWQTFRRVIGQHGEGQDRFIYPTSENSRLHTSKHPVGMDRYCIYGKAALDAPGEWFFDAATSTLYFYPPDGKKPGDLKIESKQIPEAIIVEGVQHVKIAGFAFRGTTIRMEGVERCSLQDIDIEYGSTVANPFGPNLPHPSLTSRKFSARKWFGETSVDALTVVEGSHNVIRNLTVRYSEGPGLTVGGDGNRIENCLFRDIDWHGLDYGFGIDLLASKDTTVRHVTLDHCGGSEGLRLGNHGRSLVEYCHLHHCGLRQSDGAIIQTSTAGASGTEIRYNWIHAHNAFHWGGNGIRGDDGTRGLIVHHNVVWNCREKGIVTKGDRNRIYHNTCFDNPKIDILVPRSRLPGKIKELIEQNRNSEVYHNIGLVTGSWGWEKSKLPPFAKTRRNLDAGAEILRDPGKLDFRLKNGAPATEPNAPDLGAHEYGKAAWKAGYQGRRP